VIFRETPLTGAFVLDLEPRSDDRGFFARVFCEEEFRAHALVTRFPQVSTSFNKRAGTLRGLHYRLAPNAETKLVRCVQGALLDVILDLREDSPSFGKSFSVELSSANRRMLYIPKGFAHGFYTLADASELLYWCDEPYTPVGERIIRYDDPRFGLSWPAPPSIIADKDRSAPDFDPAHHLGSAA
jgi:dTDP-4-dehydrorhamnose 3,5-epimerase